MHYGEEISPSVLRAAADSSSSQHYSAASDTYPQIENIICRPSKLQKVLRGAVENLMTLEDKQQKLLYTLLANHPILVWQKVNQMNEENSARRQPKKKALQVYHNFSPVLQRCPASFSDNQCSVDDSGKLKALFKLVTLDNDRKIVVTYFSKTMEMLKSLFDQIQSTIVKIDANISAPFYREKLDESWDMQSSSDTPFVVLLSAKYERTSSDLIGDSVVIFFDEPVDERDEPIERLIQRWNVTRANILSMDFDLPIYEEFLGDDNESQNNAKESGDDDDPIALFDEDEDETGRTAGNSQNLKATDKIWPIFQGH